MKLVDIIKLSLVGKKLKHKNMYRREVTLEVEDVRILSHHRQITPDTKENDWWGESESWETIKITFVDGSSIEVTSSTELDIVE